jgi:hypothetical protein
VTTNALRGFVSLLAFSLTLGTLGMLSSCGGGGSSVNPDFGGPVQIFPQEGTFFAGVPSIITVSGSHAPYSLTSSDPATLPVPAITNENKVVVVPNQPGVVDIGLQPNQVPIRTVNVSVRGPNATSATATIHVAQNFLISYSATITSPGCPLPSGATNVAACAGNAGFITMFAVTNGVLQGGKPFRFCNVIGDFQFFDIPTNTRMQCIVVISDHEGKVIAPFVVNNGAPTQLAIFRIQDVATGVFTDTIFTINGPGTLPQSTLTAIPSQITFTGRSGTECGTGSADVFIFDGRPPFTAFNSDTRITVTPSTSNTNPGRFTITVSTPVPPCLTAVPVVFTDATGAHVTVTVTTALGTSPPAAPITVAPNSITLNTCGASGSVSVAGGSGVYSVASSTSRIQAFVSGNTITITRIATGDPVGGITSPQAVGVTDGATTTSVQVILSLAAQNCP